MPSTVSRVVSRPLASSTVMTPSLPTFSIASAIRLPISLSLFAEMVPTWAISFLPAEGTLSRLSSSTTASTAFSIPRLSSIGLAPAVTFLRPSRKIACASTVAVVVPSPARSEVFVATSFTICAPMFSTGSDSSISLATVTPSLVMVGEPNFLSMTTFRPLGPRVIFTASAKASTPRLSRARASTLNCSSFADMVLTPRGLAASADSGEYVGRLDDEQLLVVDLERGAAVFPVEHHLAHADPHRHQLPFLASPGSDREDFAPRGFLLRGVGDVEASLHRFRLVEGSNDDSILQGVDP